jgi:hypothetical protein
VSLLFCVTLSCQDDRSLALGQSHVQEGLQNDQGVAVLASDLNHDRPEA